MAQASVVMDRVSELLKDTNRVNWTEPQLLGWVNDAQRAVCIVRPDACSVIENISLTVGVVEQSLAAGQRRLMGLYYNMGADGSTVGNAITGPKTREELDAYNPAWPTETGAEVQEYIYDEDEPDTFYVIPAIASGTWYVKAKVAKDPTDVTADTDPLGVGDVYMPALIEWLCYRAWARDDERTQNWVRAGRALENFYNLLGVKTKGDIRISPRISERGKQLEAMSNG